MACDCHSLTACQRLTPLSLAAVIGLSHNDVFSLRSLRCVRCASVMQAGTTYNCPLYIGCTDAMCTVTDLANFRMDSMQNDSGDRKVFRVYTYVREVA